MVLSENKNPTGFQTVLDSKNNSLQFMYLLKHDKSCITEYKDN